MKLNKNEITLKFHIYKDGVPGLKFEFGNYHPSYIKNKHYPSMQMGFLAHQVVNTQRQILLDVLYPFCKSFVKDYEIKKLKDAQ